LIIFAGCSKQATEARQQEASAGKADHSANADSLGLVDIHGRQCWPLNDQSTKALVMVFILPDCPICNAYVPGLNRLYEELAANGIDLVLLHADTMVTAAEASQHAREYQLQMPVALDPARTWINKAGATIAPEAAVFSPDGELLYRGRIDNQYAGLGQRRATVTSHDLRDACEAVLAGQPVKTPRTEAIGCFIPHD
jgi:hypothetical protein